MESKIISIGKAVPSFRHKQEDILQFMQNVYGMDDIERRKLRFLYSHSAIEHRYSVIGDYSRPHPEWKFYPQSENIEPFPSLEQRMAWYQKYAAPLSVDAIRNCITGKIHSREITHLITVSCTGMSAPGIDLQILELMDLPKDIFRTSINFMGCYAAIHAMKIANALCLASPHANVVIVCTELCTLHFQKQPTADNIASSLLFGDGSAAILITSSSTNQPGIRFKGFSSEVMVNGKKDMAWEMSSTGFLMTLSGYVPELVEEDFEGLTQRIFHQNKITQNDITDWCIHPGGKRILQAIHNSLHFKGGELDNSYQVLKDYGNMSSPTILFVLERILNQSKNGEQKTIFGAAFGPGLTMETFIAGT